MPVVGVEIRNDRIEPLLAPSFFRDNAAGTTPHEHNGRGMPNKDAFITDIVLFFA